MFGRRCCAHSLHPSGSVTPSDKDHAITRRLCEACALLGVTVLDHVIVGAEGHYSFADNGDLGSTGTSC